MDNKFITDVVASVGGGLLASAILFLLRIFWQQRRGAPPAQRRLDWKPFLRFYAGITVIALVVLTYLPPYSISWADWCLTSQGTTRITGEAVRLLFRAPAVGVTIQVKLFPAGLRQALHVEEFGTTDWNGQFGVELPPPQPGRGMHFINTAYNYDSPLWSDRWYIKDFRKANSPRCGIPKPLTGTIGFSSRWGSGWLDLEVVTDFRKGDRLRLTIGETADRILVRLLPKGVSPDESVGIIGGVVAVPKNRIVEVALDTDRKGITQISVHGGPNPWGRFPQGSGNGPATLEAVELIPR